MNESGGIDNAEDVDYVAEDDDFIEEGENDEGLNETINSW